VVGWIRDRAGEVEMTASVCTGAFVLGQAGLLDGHPATTHSQSLDRMQQAFPAVSVIRDQHVVDDGVIVTSAGISAGIDLALHLVARLCGDDVARATARYMEYRYPQGNQRRV
jgi:transcriptional regulator GlxA family with amidase domain